MRVLVVSPGRVEETTLEELASRGRVADCDCVLISCACEEARTRTRVPVPEGADLGGGHRVRARVRHLPRVRPVHVCGECMRCFELKQVTTKSA